MFNLTDIKQELADNWQQFATNRDPYDLLAEFADSACPVYNADIIEQWQAMPPEFDNYWQEFYAGAGMPENKGIVDLMAIDLWNYATHLYTKAYDELCQEMPNPNESETN